MIEVPPELLAEFPEKGNLVFFDHSAVAPITRRAKGKMLEFLDKIADPARINCAEFADQVENAKGPNAPVLSTPTPHPLVLCAQPRTAFPWWPRA